MNSRLSTQMKQILEMMKEHEGLDFIEQGLDNNENVKIFKITWVNKSLLIFVLTEKCVIDLVDDGKLITSSTSPLTMVDSIIEYFQ